MSARRPHRRSSPAWAALLGVALSCGAQAAAPAPPPGQTIGDLDTKAVPVQRDSKGPVGGAAKAMENYRQFLQLQNADPKLRAEALRRLGDLNLESGELERMASEVTLVDRQGAEAIRLYTTLLKGYPNYPRNDQVLYQLARAYETTGQSDLALSTLDSVVARYPQSRDIAEVQFRRGEILFSNKRYPDAQHAYEAVLAKGRFGSAFYAQSLYKHGWSLFKQGQNEDSLKSFGDLLDVTLMDPTDNTRMRKLDSLGRADRELVDDTMRVMSITFSYLDGAKSLDEFSAHRSAMPYAYMLYQRLGDLYVEKQRFQDAATTYRAFVSRDPVDEHAPLLTNAAIEAYRKGGFAELMLDGKLEYVQRYGFDAPFWNNRQHGGYPQVVADLKTNLKDVAEYYHASAQKSKKAEDYSSAAHWYRAYLSSFPGDPDSAATDYLLADALFESKQYQDAAAEYERTAYQYPKNAKSAEAGYAALVAYQKQEDGLQPEVRATVHKQATASGVKFAQTFPDHPQAAVVLTRAAQDLYASGDQTQAVQTARALLARTPPVDNAKQRIGWTIVGQVAFNQGDFPAAEDAFGHALAVAAPNDPERSDITERLADSVYKQGEAKRNAGDQSGAAADFLRVARVAPASKVIATSQYDGAAALINAQQWDKAIDVLEAYQRDYPKSQYAADVSHKLATAYVAAGRSAQAAAAFEKIASNPKEDPAVVHEATAQAADLYAQSGNSARAIPLLERLVKDYPTPAADAIEVRQRLLEIAAKNGEADRVRYWQREIVKADSAAAAGRTERTKYLAAKAQLALSTPARDEFRSIKLVAPLKQSLAAKRKALENAVQVYKEVAAYQVAETTTAATYETAELYHTLAQDLMKSERPKKMSPEELEQYNSLLEEQAFPFEEQSISIHELNTKRALDGVYDESVRKSFAALAELKPARYGKTELSAGMMGPAAQPGPPPVPPPSAAVQADFQRILDLANAGKNTDAELELKQFQLQHAGYAAPAIDLGLLTRQEGKLSDSEASLRYATALDSTSAVAWDELGITLRSEGKFADARAAYQRAIAANDSYAPAHRNMGVLLDLYIGDPAAAIPEFERYKALTSEDKPVGTWIAELRARTGIKAPAPAQPSAPATPDNAAPGAPAPAPSSTAAGNNGGPT
ncbi:MAG TPA: tetratricopeptide repeat protein [Steroidobacteraceae bacterium]|jgi:tetratricopeptide (TPR) repeat protein|nr:tetratricopeptide repeat protein [Steroidobacteraceae bacterium]